MLLLLIIIITIYNYCYWYFVLKICKNIVRSRGASVRGGFCHPRQALNGSHAFSHHFPSISNAFYFNLMAKSKRYHSSEVKEWCSIIHYYFVLGVQCNFHTAVNLKEIFLEKFNWIICDGHDFYFTLCQNPEGLMLIREP